MKFTQKIKNHKEVVNFINSITDQKAVIDFFKLPKIMINKDLIVALDVPNKNELINTLNRLPDIINWYKVGLELFIAEGRNFKNFKIFR